MMYCAGALLGLHLIKPYLSLTMSAEATYSKIIPAFQQLYQELKEVDVATLLQVQEPAFKFVSKERFQDTKYDEDIRDAILKVATSFQPQVINLTEDNKFASIVSISQILASRKEEAIRPCVVLFLGTLISEFVLHKLQEVQILFLLEIYDRYFGTRIFRDLKITTLFCVQTNCGMVFHFKFFRISLIGAQQALSVTLLATLL